MKALMTVAPTKDRQQVSLLFVVSWLMEMNETICRYFRSSAFSASTTTMVKGSSDWVWISDRKNAVDAKPL